MSDAWYYAEGDKSIGPITLADLIAILSRVSDAQSVFVWRGGLAGWVQAKNLPELAPHVTKPPPLPIKGPIPETEDKELKLTWLRMMRVWWACLWRFWIGALFVGLSFFLVGLIPRSEVSEKPIVLIGDLIWVFLAATVLPMVVLTIALRRNYGDFRLALVPPEPKVDDSRRNREWSKEEKSDTHIASIFAALCVAVIIWLLAWAAIHR